MLINTVTPSYLGWKPGANTLAYYPFNGNANDYSGNGYNLSAFNVGWGDTINNGNYCAYFNGTSAYAINTAINKTISGGTMNVWVKKRRNNSDEVICQFAVSPARDGGYGNNDGGWIIRSTSTQLGNITHTLYYNAFVFDAVDNTGIANGTRMNVCCVTGSSGNKLYINGQEVTSNYNYGNSSTAFGSRNFNRICAARHQHVSAEYAECNLSEWIIEDKERTAQEIADYYNLTKSNYGL